MLDKKYGNGARTNRATEKGYWKTTGKDRAVYHRSQIVGMKKTLVYHIGCAPKGERTNWVMHEYRLADLELERAGIHQDAFVLCRVFQKSGSGPKNGEQYGAPFVEEEWLDDESEIFPKAEMAEVVDFGDDAYLDGDDLEQILGLDAPSVDSPLPSNLPAVGSCIEGTAESVNDDPKLLLNATDQYCEPEQHDDKNLHDIPAPYEGDVRAVKHEFIGESSNSGNFEGLDFLLDEPFQENVDVTFQESADVTFQGNADVSFQENADDLPYGSVGFIDANDLIHPVDTNLSPIDKLEDYLAFYNANIDNSHDFNYDPSTMLGSEDLIPDDPILPPPEPKVGGVDSTLPGGQSLDNNDGDVASASDKLDSSKYESDFQYPFLRHASHMLGSIPAPSALAADFPSKDALHRLNSLSQPSTSVHVTAGMIQIRNLTSDGMGEDQSLGKPWNLNIVLSFGFSRDEDGSARLESSFSLLPGKTVSTLSRVWFYLMFLVLVISISYKMGSCICAN